MAIRKELLEELLKDYKGPGDLTGENRRNGNSSKTVRTDQGPMNIEVPRDREGTFEPKIIEKHQREFAGFSDKMALAVNLEGKKELLGLWVDRPVPGIRPRDPKGHVYDQCDRVAELQHPQGHQESSGISNRRCGDKVGLHGLAEYLGQCRAALTKPLSHGS